MLIIILLLGILYWRYRPRFDKIKLINDNLLILWYNKDFKGLNRDYIILWKTK